MRVEWIDYKGGRVLFANFKDVTDQDEMLKVLNEFFDIIKVSTIKVNTLTDVTNATTGPDFMSEGKRLGEEYADKFNKRAILGITGLKRIILKGYNAFTKGDTPNKSFETKQEALDYLVS